MGTWLSYVGNLHKRFAGWAFDNSVKGWRSILRTVLYTIVDILLWFVVIWGSFWMILVFISTFSKNDEEPIID